MTSDVVTHLKVCLLACLLLLCLTSELELFTCSTVLDCVHGIFCVRDHMTDKHPTRVSANPSTIKQEASY